MNRREAILTTGSIFVSASIGAIACGGANAGAQDAKTPGAGDVPPGLAGHVHGDPAVADAALDCLAKGNACVAHCLGMLGSGDTSMLGCARSSYDMTAAMEALARLASTGSSHLPAFAKVAMDFCRDCQAECQKHADRHPVCKDCLDACTRSIAALQKIAA
jgi:Cys-rich four helix bundle protein (predicted Tat secretion target)